MFLQMKSFVLLVFGKLQSFENKLQYGGRYGFSVGEIGQAKASLLKPLVVETEAGCVPAKHLNFVALFIEETE
jgi:hypothetical protein